jgi:hypothetical protein
MKSIYKNEYVEIFLDFSRSLIIDVWTKESENATLEEFKEVLCVWRDTIIDHHLKYALNDTRYFHNLMTPEVQDWITENIYMPAQQVSLQKNAFVMSQGFIEALSLEQLVEDQNIIGLVSYFASFEEAESWLFEDKTM